MAAEVRRSLALAAAGLLLGAAAAASTECRLAPPAGPFAAALATAGPPPAPSELASNAGSWSTLIRPAPNHRWEPKTGLVESTDGSLRLSGLVNSPRAEASRLNLAVLVDYAAPVGQTMAVLDVFDDRRGQRLGREHAARAGFAVEFEAEGAAVAFDIALPAGTVPAGAWREIQTLVWLDGGPIDARRWTVYSGPQPPVPVECLPADEALPQMERRTRFEADGTFVVRAPRPASLAVVPIEAAGVGEVRFLRIDEARLGAEIALGDDVELAAAWEDPFSGPGKRWISSFWSARRP